METTEYKGQVPEDGRQEESKNKK